VTWLAEAAPGASRFAAVLGLRPELRDDLDAFTGLLWSGRPIDASLLDVCRIRIGQLHGAPRALDHLAVPGAVAADPAAIACWRTDSGFGDVERAVLALAEAFALDPHAADDACVAAVTGRLSAPELVALAEALAIADGFTRFAIVLGIEPAGAHVADADRRETRTPPGARSAARVPSSTPRIAPPESRGDDAISGSVLAHQPELLRAFLRLYGTLWSHGVVDHATKEVLRLRNARITDCNYCKNVRFSEARREGLTEDLVTLIDDQWQESRLPRRHKIALRLADAFLLDPHGLTPEARTALRAEFSPAELVEMTAALALFMGFSKITVVLGREPAAMPTTIVPTPDRPH